MREQQIEPYKRRAKGRIRKTVTVRGHYHSLPKLNKYENKLTTVNCEKECKHNKDGVCELTEIHLVESCGRSTDYETWFMCEEEIGFQTLDTIKKINQKMKKRIVLGTTRLFQTTAKTTTKQGKREYMRQYMKAYRDLTRQRKYSPRKRNTTHENETLR